MWWEGGSFVKSSGSWGVFEGNRKWKRKVNNEIIKFKKECRKIVLCYLRG